MHEVSGDPDVLQREVARLRVAADHAERKLRAIDAVDAVVAGETSAEAGMPRILGGVGAALGCSIASFWAPGGDDLALVARWTADDVEARHAAPRTGSPGATLAGRIWAERCPLGIADIAADRALPDQGALIEAGIRSGFGFPVAHDGDLLGVVELYTRRPEVLDVPLTELLPTLGARLGQFLHRAASDAAERRRHGELEQASAALARLNAVGRTIAAELDPKRLAQIVIDAATELTGAECGALFYSINDNRVESYMLYAVSGTSRERFAGLALPRNTPLLSPAFLGQAVVRLGDVTTDPRYGRNYPHRGVPEGHPAMRSYLAVPVVSRGGTALAAMFLGHTERDVFGEPAERAAIELAAYAATAMDNAQLYHDAQRLIAELEKANAELDQFAYAASHDLRAPLRGISNLATWIDEDLPPATPDSTREHLRMLRLRAGRMDRLISGLLELARVGRTRQQPERVDVTTLLHETIEMVNPREASRIMMIGEMPMLIAERAALQQVFLHLITNALVHAGRDDVVIRISAIDRGDDWELAIEDNGVGIPPDHHARVWQPFQTLQSRDVVDTTGIGLAIVRKQVESHGGRAWIDPSAGVGATVRFTWPKRAR
ncbi:MAG TPA: GAF domain-containing protein [Kofleriaceae bacterium]|jgi:signal transduction histidine kinase